MSSAPRITSDGISTTSFSTDRNLLSEVPGFTTLDPCIKTVLSYCIDDNYYPACPSQSYMAIAAVTDSISCLCHNARSQILSDIGSWSCESNLQTAAQEFFVNTYCPLNDMGSLRPATVLATSTDISSSSLGVTTSTAVVYTTVSCTSAASGSSASTPTGSDANANAACAQDSAYAGAGYGAGSGLVGAIFLIWFLLDHIRSAFSYVFDGARAPIMGGTEAPHLNDTSVVQNNFNVTFIAQPEGAFLPRQQSTHHDKEGKIDEKDSGTQFTARESETEHNGGGGIAQPVTDAEQQQSTGVNADDRHSESINSDSSASHVLQYVARPERTLARDHGQTGSSDPRNTI